MLVNGIDHAAREAEFAAIGIDSDGPMSQFADIGVATVYCSPHKAPHLTAHSGCEADMLEKFPLDATTYDEALTECRVKGYRLDGEPYPCQHCGQTVMPDRENPHLHRLITVADGSPSCPDNNDHMYGGGHQYPFGMSPVWRGTTT